MEILETLVSPPAKDDPKPPAPPTPQLCPRTASLSENDLLLNLKKSAAKCMGRLSSNSSEHDNWTKRNVEQLICMKRALSMAKNHGIGLHGFLDGTGQEDIYQMIISNF